jgi:hypothetical protein
MAMPTPATAPGRCVDGESFLVFEFKYRSHGMFFFDFPPLPPPFFGLLLFLVVGYFVD